MNRHFNKIFFLFLALMAGMSACKKDGALVTATSGTQPGLTASATILNYTQADSASNAVTFTYTPSDFGYKAAVGSELEFSYNDSNFTSYKNYTLSLDTLSMSFTVANFNNLVFGLNYVAGVKDTVYARVKSTLTGATVGLNPIFKYSDTVAIVVTPYSNKVTWPIGGTVPFPFLYVPGGYQGWGPGNAIIAKVYSPSNNGVYDGYANITDITNGNNQFKFTNEADWNGTNYGSGDNVVGGGSLSTNSSAGNLTVAATGYYLLHADITNLQWTATLQNWSIIGDFNSWLADVPFDFDATEQVLVKTLQLPAGGLKFRANNDWTVQWGGDGTSINPTTGAVGLSSSSSSGNITIAAAGTYKITLDLRVPTQPECTIVKQ